MNTWALQHHWKVQKGVELHSCFLQLHSPPSLPSIAKGSEEDNGKQMSSLGAALSLTLSLCASLKGPFMVNCPLATSEHDVEIHQHDKTEPLGHGKVATAWGARLAGALHKSSGNGHAFVPLYSGGNDLVNAWHLPFPPVPPLTPHLTLSQEIFVLRWPFPDEEESH